MAMLAPASLSKKKSLVARYRRLIDEWRCIYREQKAILNGLYDGPLNDGVRKRMTYAEAKLEEYRHKLTQAEQELRNERESIGQKSAATKSTVKS